jgi:3-oxoacyl-[acyl-carrier protein] reductase
VAKELGSRNAFVNAIAPGFIETEMTQALNADVKNAILKTIPVGFFGRLYRSQINYHLNLELT